MEPGEIYVLFIVLILAVIAAGCLFKPTKRSPFQFPSAVPHNLPKVFEGGVLNAKYQYDSPNVIKESKYYGCLLDECKGNTHNFDCLERCRLKAMMDHDLRYVSPLKAANCYGKTGDDYVNCLVFQYAKMP